MGNNVDEKGESKPRELTWLAYLGVMATFIIAGNSYRPPHNIQIHGTVAQEEEVYGNPEEGYAAKKGDVLRTGEKLHLYQLDTQIIEYDQRIYFENTHVVIRPGEDLPEELVDKLGMFGQIRDQTFYLVTEGDAADVGDSYSVPLEAASCTMAENEIKLYVDGQEEPVILRYVVKDPNNEIKFKENE